MANKKKEIVPKVEVITGKLRCLYNKLVPIPELKPHPRNHNDHSPEQIKMLAKLLVYQGVRKPCIVSNQSDFMTTWHGRLEAAKQLGWTHVPVNFQNYDDEDQEFADLTADNASASWAIMDYAKINAELPKLEGVNFDIEWLGIKDFEIEPADFVPGTEGEQGKLDERSPIECPNCGKSFIPK